MFYSRRSAAASATTFEGHSGLLAFTVLKTFVYKRIVVCKNFRVPHAIVRLVYVHRRVPIFA